ncbi:MAG: FAD-binding oxidoreductase [Proteobacteria bacterium]|nr:FAD-binding oxidoreductase [Pseudomonadota bacterium]
MRLAIIGAGTVGCGAARRAAELGVKELVVFERRTPAGASSGLSAGVFNVQTLDPLDIELRIRAREIMVHLQKTRSLHLSRIGAIRMTTQEADIPRFERSIETQRALGADDSRIISRAEIHALVPDVKVDDIVAGLHGPNEGHLDGYTYCAALLDDAKDFGARVRVNTEVTGYRKAQGVHYLKAGDGELAFDAVINAAGAWAGKVGQLLGHPAPVRPDVHEVIIAKLARKLPYTMPFCNFYIPGAEGESVYFRQEAADTLVTGMHTYVNVPGSAVKDFDHYSPINSDDYLQTVAEKLYERLPLDDIGLKSGWFGLYPISADNRFIIGPYRADPTVIAAAGFGGVGVTSGAAGGACAAEWAVLGRLHQVPAAEALLPDRPSLAGLW